jgi:hypothetical protein
MKIFQSAGTSGVVIPCSSALALGRDEFLIAKNVPAFDAPGVFVPSY